MDYERRYPITQQPGDYVLVLWERGYKRVEVYYKDRLVGEVDGAARLKAGVRLADTELNSVELKLAEKPVVLNVIVDGYHSPVNSEHPVKEMKSLALWFWIITALSGVGSTLEIGWFRNFPAVQSFLIGFTAIILTVYVAAALLTRNGKAWAYWMGFGMFTFIFLFEFALHFVLFSGAGILDIIFLAIRIGGLVILSIGLKTVIAAGRHNRFKQPVSEDLLDQ